MVDPIYEISPAQVKLDGTPDFVSAGFSGL